MSPRVLPFLCRPFLFTCFLIVVEALLTPLCLVLQARDLLNASPEGFSDPYVVLSVGGKRTKTSIEKKTLDPEWNYEHELYYFFHIPLCPFP